MNTFEITQRRFRGLSLSALAIAMTVGASAAQAQQAEPATNADCAAGNSTNDSSCGDIIVTGYANSLSVATNTKRNANQIVESVSAEDIGRLPDASIGEAIARLPGVTSQRLNGRSNGIAVRGLGPDFTQSLLNGREQTSTGDNRAVEYDQYPSEIVNQVVVIKSPSAAQVGQGLAGTIDIRTVRPLDAPRRVFAIGARGSYADLGRLNADSREFGYRLNGTFIDQFINDTVGVALSASYVNEPYQLQEFNAWGYAGSGTTADPAVIGGSKSYATSTNLERLGVNGTLQIDATPTLRLTLDGFYSHFNDDQARRGIELPLGFGAFGTTLSPSGQTIRDGTIVAGTFNNVRGVIRNDRLERQADLYSGGFNARYQGTDGWSAFFDFGYSRTDRNELNLESYAGTGFNGDDTGIGSAATIGFQSGTHGTVFSPNLDYSNYNSIFLTDPLGWGGGTVPQAGYYNNRIVKDELKQYHVEVERELGGIFHSIQVGMNYTDRSKSLTPDEYLIRLPGGALTATIPTQYRLATTNLSYLGLGPVVSYDARDLIAGGVLVLESNNANNDVRAKAYTVTENLMTLYGQLNIDTHMLGGDLTGNIGLQAIHTDQRSSGPTFVNGTYSGENRLGASYWDVLPSLNLSLRLPSDTVIRFAAAREVMRPRLDDMRVAIGFGVNTSSGTPFYDGSGGNPYLRPYRANAVDLTFEQYFGRGGVVSLQLFYKDIQDYIDTGFFLFDYASVPRPTTGIIPASTIGRLKAPINTGGGSFYGVELGANVPLGSIVPALDGFGITGGAAYVNSNVLNAAGVVANIPGYSDWTLNGTLYFEKWGFNARASARHRSTFLADFSGFGGNPTRRQALGETILDAQIGYDFPEGSFAHGLSLYVQGQNLTNERFTSVQSTATPLQVIDYQTYGRRILAGFTFRF